MFLISLEFYAFLKKDTQCCQNFYQCGVNWYNCKDDIF